MVPEIVSGAIALVKDAVITDVLRERLLAIIEEENRLREKQADADKTIAELRAEIARLNEEKARYQQQKLDYEAAVKFVEYRGALWKMKPDGAFHPVPYCPSCRIAISAIEPFLPFRCGKCRFMATFKGQDLESVLAELPG